MRRKRGGPSGRSHAWDAALPVSGGFARGHTMSPVAQWAKVKTSPQPALATGAYSGSSGSRRQPQQDSQGAGRALWHTACLDVPPTPDSAPGPGKVCPPGRRAASWARARVRRPAQRWRLNTASRCWCRPQRLRHARHGSPSWRAGSADRGLLRHMRPAACPRAAPQILKKLKSTHRRTLGLPRT